MCDSINFGMNLESYCQAFAIGNGEQPESLGYLDFWAMTVRLRSFLAGTVLERGESAEPEWVGQRLVRFDWGRPLLAFRTWRGRPQVARQFSATMRTSTCWTGVGTSAGGARRFCSSRLPAACATGSLAGATV